MKYHILISLENLHNLCKEEDVMEICVRMTWVCWYVDVLSSKKDFLANKNKVKVIGNLTEGMTKSLGYLLKTKDKKNLKDIRDYAIQLDMELLELWDFNEHLGQEFLSRLDTNTTDYLKVLYQRKDTLREVS